MRSLAPHPGLDRPLRVTRLAGLAVALAALPACVSSGSYDAVTADNARFQQSSAALERELTTARNKLAALEEQDAMLRLRLDRLGTSVSDLRDEKGTLYQALEDTRARLDEANRRRIDVEQRMTAYRSLAKRLAQSIDDGSLDIEARDDRLILSMRDDVMFDSGATKVKGPGRKILVEVAEALRDFPQRHFQVAGHTDNQPIASARFSSNWELSTSRAVAVLRVMLENGVPAASLSAAGYGEFDPVAPNTTAEGRHRNRRIEITVMPAIRETPPLIP